METLETWLAALGLEKYLGHFRDQDVAFDQLPSLNDADLKELGLPLGPRKRILEALRTGTGKPAPSLATPGAERRQLTIMFVDLVGSTALSGRLDPEDLRNVLREYHETCAAAITRWGGLVAKLMGDGVLAYFGWPQAMETAAERAIRAGLDINARVAKLKTPQGEQMSARTGIATGLVVVGDLIGDGAAQEAAVAGETPNLAARLQGCAEPGGLVVSASTLSLAGAQFAAEELPPLSLKGISGSVSAFVVKAAREATTRFAARAGDDLSPLLGREQELALLMDRYRRARSGEGQLTVLTADAGMGKSRLADALVKAIAAEGDDCAIWQCAPYHTSTPFHPVGPALTPETLDALSALERDALATLRDPAAPPPAGLTPAQARHLVLSAIGSWVRLRRGGGTSVLLVEDAHWIDPSTLEALDANLDDWSRAKVFVLVTARPSFRASFSGHASVTHLSLGRLSRQGVDALAVAAAGGHSLPEEALAEIAARSDGVPLYVEETAKALAASGAMALDGGAWTLVRPLSQGGVPASLADGLMARLDRLAAVKDVAQEASVLGREFSYPALAALCRQNAETLDTALDQLCDAQILTAHGARPAASYSFKHALLRDAAYDSLLKARRATLHARVLEHLESQADTRIELLALHAEAAGDRGRATALWRQAGESAMARPAFHEAISHFRRALALADGTTALQIETRLGLAAIAAQGHAHPQTVAIFEAASKNPLLATDAPSAFVVWYGLWCGHHVRGEAALAQESSAALHAASLAEGSAGNIMMGVRSLGITALMRGDAHTALAQHRDAEAMEDIPRDREQARIVGQDQSVSFRSYYGLTLWLTGQGRSSWDMIMESVRLARDGGHPGSLGYGLTHAILAAIGLGQVQAAKAWTTELFDRAGEYRLGMWRDYALRYQGLLDLADGLDSGPALLAARSALGKRGVGLFGAFLDVAAADACLDRNDADGAARWLDLAAEFLDGDRECWAKPEDLRVRARLAAMSGATSDARRMADAAVRMAMDGGLWALALKSAVLARSLGTGPSEDETLRILVSRVDGLDAMPGLSQARGLLADG